MSNNIETLLETIAKLRSKDGCSWDRKQTHISLLPFLLEETWEFIQAIHDQADADTISEELGDVLLQIVLHAQIAKEAGHFTFEEVAKKIQEKMVRRHPHVFAENKDEYKEADLKRLWETIKQEENKGKQTDLFSSVPLSAPALFVAFKLGQKAKTQGFTWQNVEDTFAKVKEEVEELEAEIEAKQRDNKKLEHEIGDLLFSICNVARECDIMPEIALHKCNERFITRYKNIDKQYQEAKSKGEELTLEEMEELWQKAKAQET